MSLPRTASSSLQIRLVSQLVDSLFERDMELCLCAWADIWKLSCVGKLVNFYSSVSQSIAQTLTQSLFVCLVSQIKITSRKSDLP